MESIERSREEELPDVRRKKFGAYYTPDALAATLVSWAVRDRADRLLDPACGDGRFLAGHRHAVGIEQDPASAGLAMSRAPWALVHEGDFFGWASQTTERFECAAGNPPFIRYQHFKGDVRARALALCSKLGTDFSGLASSWAPFIVATAGLLKRGGRMAFVVPAEIGHAPYAAPVLEHLVANFSTVHVIAVREKLFPDLSEDCWLLFAEGKGGSTAEIRFTPVERFSPGGNPPRQFTRVSVAEWRSLWHRRLRPYLLAADGRGTYAELSRRADTVRLGDIAAVGIGYVSGANDFFHLRLSEAKRRGIPRALLHASVRNGRMLPPSRLTAVTVKRWIAADDPVMLLRLPKSAEIPVAVKKYLRTEEAERAREAYKCRVRDPWFSVPDVQVPHFFLSYMSGGSPALVRNDAGCTCTNSVHGVRVRGGGSAAPLRVWNSPFVRLSCEIEGHPLGGGLLKVEPGEAGRIALPADASLKGAARIAVDAALDTMRSWRHGGAGI